LTKANAELEKKVGTLTAQCERLEDEKRIMEEQFQDEI
jgi:chaperonin cofactor prefoldin